MKKTLFTILVVMIPLTQILANDIGMSLLLNDVETQALTSSYYSKALGAEIDAAKNKIKAANSFIYPKLVLDANYKYINEVPSLNLPGGARSAFGDNHNYSIGPLLSWTVWDSGSSREYLKSAKANGDSKEAEKKLSETNLLLKARLAYFKVQLRQEQLRLVTDSLKLAESQYRDIKNKVGAGSSTRIDLLSAHKEVLNLKIQSRQLQTDLSNELRDIFTITGIDSPKEISTTLKVDSINDTLKKFIKYDNKIITKNDLDQHPLIKIHSSNAQAMRATSEGLSSNNYPKITIFAKTSIDYPNGPVLESIHQNTIGLNLSIPLFDKGRTGLEATEKMNMAVASDNRREQARVDLFNDWEKSKDQLKGLQDKIIIYQKAIVESEERARLIYSSYRFGRSSFLEVQSSNLHALDLKVQSTANDIQILIQLAYLASISEE